MGDFSRINTNVAAIRAYQRLSEIQEQILKLQEMASTGKKINRTSDDPASYYAARSLEHQILTSDHINVLA